MNTDKPQGGMRLASLDALRGADMCLIIGLDLLLRSLAGQFSGCEAWQKIGWHMGHAAWEGLRVYDMVFPLFVFIAGIAMGISMQRGSREGRKWWWQLLKLWKRAAILVVLGWIINGPLSWDAGSMRYASVLGLIGISCAAAGSIGLALRHTALRAGAAAIILAGVWAAQYFGGDMSPAGCINAYLDQHYLPGVLHYEVIDPEGVLCVVAATALALGGMVCGGIISHVQQAARRVGMLFGIGVGLIVAGLYCGPIIKNIWSTGFTVSMLGWGFLFMACMHLVVDVWGWQRWCFPLRVIGMNALFIYLFTHVLPFDALTTRLFGGCIRCLVPQAWGNVAHYSLYLLLAWWLCFILYRRRVFFKI